MFDPDNPWHRYLHLCFVLHCESCLAEFGIHNASSSELDGDFVSLCVILADRAQERGWRAAGEWSFRCPVCTTASSPQHGGA